MKKSAITLLVSFVVAVAMFVIGGIVIVWQGATSLDFLDTVFNKLKINTDFFIENIDLSNYEVTTNTNQSIDLSEINKIVIDSRASNLNITNGDKNELNAVMYNSYGNTNNVTLQTAVNDNTLYIKARYGNDHNHIYSVDAAKLIIQLPKDYSKDIDIYITTSENYISLSNSFKDVHIKTSMADTTVNLLSGENISVLSTAGSFKLNSLNVKKLTINNIMGNIECTDISAEITVDCIMGEVDIDCTDIYGELIIDAVMSNIDIDIPNDTGVNLSSSSKLSNVENSTLHQNVSNVINAVGDVVMSNIDIN